MGIQDLQKFLETQAEGSAVPVDLVRIARSFLPKKTQRNSRLPSGKLTLVVDGECCLDRLYGGYFSDWACGGQWNRMVQFLAVLIQTVQASHIDLAVFFNGCLEQQRMNEWVTQQQETRQRINQILKHVSVKGTPPPKVWWTSPVCLRTALRMALRHLGVAVLCTMDDHHQEVIGYCREYGFSGLIADDGEYAVFDPPRYFSAEQLKLTYKGSLETKEYILNELIKKLEVSTDRFFVLAALLGNYLLTERDLSDFYRKIGITQPISQVTSEKLVKTVTGFVKNLPSVDNLDFVAGEVFGSPNDKRAAKFKQSVQYYLNGTKDGFLKYKLLATGRGEPSSHSKATVNTNNKVKEVIELDTSKFASETVESERDSLALYNEATGRIKKAPQIVIDPPAPGSKFTNMDIHNELKSDESSMTPTVNGAPNSGNMLLSSSSSSSSSSATSPCRLTPDAAYNQSNKNTPNEEAANTPKPASLPTVSPEVMRTASERHQKGLMSPYIYQILTQGEIKLPVLLEDENYKELPSIHHLFRPVRQMVYAILFNLHHTVFMATKAKEKEKEKNDGSSKTSKAKTADKPLVPDLNVKEWIWTKKNPCRTPDLVKAEEIGWGVPTIQRLWFGGSIDDKRRRLRAFLTCMRSDTPLMLNPQFVPQHLLVMATVLRYIMSFPDLRILRKSELDAFIVQALSPELMNAEYLQELKIPVVSSRSLQLAALFMQGVDTALLANDACGAPIPWLMCCPWLFFDGKLFHHKLDRTAEVKNLLELCDHNMDQVVKVERMRKAILENLDVQFARPPLPQMPGPPLRLQYPTNILPAGAPLQPRPSLLGCGGGRGVAYPANGIARGMMRRPVPSRGGQLEVAGIVVGSWGPNYGTSPLTAPPAHAPRASMRVGPQQITAVGGLKGYRQANGVMPGWQSLPPSRPSFSTRNTKTAAPRSKKNQNNSNKKKNNIPAKKIIQREPEKGKGRGLTIACSEEEGGALSVSELINSMSLAAKKEETQEKVPGQFDDAAQPDTSNTSANNDTHQGKDEDTGAAALPATN